MLSTIGISTYGQVSQLTLGHHTTKYLFSLKVSKIVRSIGEPKGTHLHTNPTKLKRSESLYLSEYSKLRAYSFY